jgi:hypothetical protein
MAPAGRKLTKQELAHYGEESMIRGLENSLFSASCPQDMQAVKLLAQTRAPFEKILELL